MKCPNCGAEIKDGSKFCEFCGSQISLEMRKEQEQLHKAGCPNCGSTNITFTREKQGEIRGKKGTAVVRATVGVCKDCGYTWTTQETAPKKRKTWLWVLGWIFCFPIPLTILMLREPSKLKKQIRYGIIAVAWIVYLIMMLSNRGNSSENKTEEPNSSAIVEESTSEVKNETSTTATVKEEKEEASVAETAESSKTDSQESEESSSAVESSVVETSTVDGVTPEFKEFVDSYEAFMDQYIEFMKSFDKTNATMLIEYSQLLAEYADFTAQCDAYKEEDLSDADNAYFLEVLTRVNTKLTEAAITLQ